MDKKAYIRQRLEKPVIFIGLMGVGKTKIGGLLAKALNIPFIDSDHEIEAAAGCKIADIFQMYGEPAFRDLEKKTIARLVSGGPKVLSLGGGAIMAPETAERVWSEGIAIWLKADLQTMLRRATHNQVRPLLKENPEAVLQALSEKRYPVYARAPISVDSTEGTPKVALNKIIDALHGYLNDAR